MSEIGMLLGSSRAVAAEVLERLENVMQREGRSLKDLDLSDEACLTVEVFNLIVNEMPRPLLSQLAQNLLIPHRSRKNPNKTIRWIFTHWYRESVRQTIYELIEFLLNRPPFNQEVLDPEAVKAQLERGMPWSVLAWAAYHSPDPLAVEKCRGIYGPEEWDEKMKRLRLRVRPVLLVMLTLPYLEKAAKEERDEAVRRQLEEQVRSLSWEAETAKLKHEKATRTVSRLKEEVERLRVELAERERRIQELEEELREQRRAFGEFTAVIREVQARQSAAIARGDLQAAMPLAGKEVAVVGGDPIHDFVENLIEAMGGKARLYSGVSKLNQLVEAGSADLLVVITTFLEHKAMPHINAMRERMPVIYVNQKGIGAVRRALQSYLEQQSAAGRQAAEREKTLR